MKTLQKTLAVAATVLAVAVYADVSVEDVKCTPRYPWNGLVDIEYTIGCDDPDAEIYVNPVGFNGDTGLTVFPTHFTGDGATNTVKAGKHTMVWDAKADMGNLFSCKNFQIKIYAGKKLSRYIVIDISGGTEAENYPIRHSVEGPNLDDDTCRTTEIWMRLIPPGTFMMGSPEDELGRESDEGLHKVTLTMPYYMGVFEVTQHQWMLVKGTLPSAYSGIDADTRPVENVSYNMVKCEHKNDYYGSLRVHLNMNDVSEDSFLGKLRRKTGCVGFDLPTEAQWEYACRTGVSGAKYDGRGLTGVTGDKELELMCHFVMNGNGKPACVGSYIPNVYGLYDMLGNVREMCREEKYSYETGYVIDPEHYWTLAYSGNYLVIRGGGWNSRARECRSADRNSWTFFWARDDAPTQVNEYYCSSDIGFRLMASGSLQD